MSAIIGVFLFWSERSDNKKKSISPSSVFLATFLAFIGFKNWIFAMKNWKLSLLIKWQNENKDFTTSKFEVIEKIFYYFGMLSSAIFPLGVFISIINKNQKYALGFYLAFIVVSSFSGFFLLAALFTISK